MVSGLIPPPLVVAPPPAAFGKLGIEGALKLSPIDTFLSANLSNPSPNLRISFAVLLTASAGPLNLSPMPGILDAALSKEPIAPTK